MSIGKATALGLLTVILCSFSGDLPAEEHSTHGPAPAPKKKTEEPRVPIEVAAEQQSRMGIRTAKAETRPAEHVIRTVGSVSSDQSREAHVHTRINGWIEKIHVDSVGKSVKKGESLYDLYSPELVSTQAELLAARRQKGIGAEIARAAADRLKLWGVTQAEIDSIIRSGSPKRNVTFRSPVNGFVINKTAIQGMYVTPEMELYYIADLSEVWLIVTLYEHDVAAVKAGDVAEIELPYSPGKKRTAPVAYVYPEIDVETRTARARIELPNPDQTLKPGMFAQVEIRKSLGNALMVPDDSIIDTGVRKIVFVKTAKARFEPREVKVGPRVGESFAVLDGLKSGEEVVISAHFLLDAESRLQAALRRSGGEDAGAGAGHGGHGNP